jgi:hypothetical protein
VDRVVASYRLDVHQTLEAFSLLPVDSDVLERAIGPFATTVGSLDAIHLASALMIRAEIPDLVFATHDDELGLAARAHGFVVHGISRGI